MFSHLRVEVYMGTLASGLTCAFALILTLATFAQTNASLPAKAHPAPQVSGKLIDTDGIRRLSVAYQQDSNPRTFTGTINAECALPASAASGNGKPLPLSEIPIGTEMTLFYVPRKSGNVVLALRLDQVRHKGSQLPQGVSIPCFAQAQQSKP